MSREKQIEQIRKDMFAAFGGYAKWEEAWQSLWEIEWEYYVDVAAFVNDGGYIDDVWTTFNEGNS